jgi:ADP-ribose pyrophosphatase
VTDRQVVYDGRIVKLGLETAVFPNGHRVALEIIRHPGAAAVVPLHADGTVTLVHQHRHAAGGMTLEVPAGVLEAGEAPAVCAARELAEEAQLAATELRFLSAIFTTPGFTDEKIHLFLARGLRVAEGEPEEDEYIRLVRLPLAEALAGCSDGRITDGKTICALHLAAAVLQAERSDAGGARS